MAAAAGLQDVPESKDFSFPAEARPVRTARTTSTHARARARTPPEALDPEAPALTLARRTRTGARAPQEEKVLAFWDEIDAFKTQLKLTEGKPECVRAAQAAHSHSHTHAHAKARALS